MLFTEYRVRHDAIRSQASILTRERLLADLLKETTSDEELVAAARLLVARCGSPTESLTTGIAERYVGGFLGLPAKPTPTIDAIKAEYAKGANGPSTATLLEFYQGLREYCQQPSRTEALKDQLLATWRSRLGPDDARLAIELIVANCNNQVDEIQICYAAAAAWHPQTCYGGAAKWDQGIRKQIKQAYTLEPDASVWAKRFRHDSLTAAIVRAKPTPGLPLAPQLADRVDELDDVFKQQLHGTVMEPKLDGERIMAHKDANTNSIWLYTRQLKLVTATYPEVVQALRELPGTDWILDGELVALGTDNSVLPFNVLQTRLSRKDSLDSFAKTTRTGIVFYDIVRLNGETLLHKNYEERRAALTAVIPKDHSVVRVINQRRVSTAAELQDALEEAAAQGAEGVMCKALGPGSHYEPGERHSQWVKLKPDYLTGVGDTLDLVIIGWLQGGGKRANKMGALLLGAHNPQTGHVESLTKIGTGFTDADLAHWTPRLQEITVATKPPNIICTGGDPDHWVIPKIVIEVQAAEVTRSPRYDAGKNGDGTGISLRFPRYLKERADKDLPSSTSVQELLKMVKT